MSALSSATTISSRVAGGSGVDEGPREPLVRSIVGIGRAPVVRQPALGLLGVRVGSDSRRRQRSRGVDPLRRKMRGSERNGHDERAAFTDRALHPHLAAVQLDQLLNERQADARAFVGSGLRALDPMKTLEHPRALVLGNADARVADPQFRRTVDGPQRDASPHLRT